MKLNARDEVVATGSDISVNGAKVKVTVFHGYALRGTPHYTGWLLDLETYYTGWAKTSSSMDTRFEVPHYTHAVYAGACELAILRIKNS